MEGAIVFALMSGLVVGIGLLVGLIALPFWIIGTLAGLAHGAVKSVGTISAENAGRKVRKVGVGLFNAGKSFGKGLIGKEEQEGI